MTTEITTPQNFEDRLKARIKDSIGELVSDDDLKRIIERGIEDALFNPRRILTRTDSWGNKQYDTGPPLVQEIVTPLLREEMASAVAQWLRAHPDTVEKIIAESLGKGITAAVTKAIDEKMQHAFWQFGEAIKNGLLQRS